jgi:hypothetical protein
MDLGEIKTRRTVGGAALVCLVLGIWTWRQRRPEESATRRNRGDTANVKFFVVNAPEVWGDHLTTAVVGMTSHLPRRHGRLQLERAGPIAPPLSVSGNDLIVNEEAKQRLEESGLGTFEFVPVIKAKIVELHWEDWDRSRPLDEEVVVEDPEYTIISRRHSERAAEQMGELYEVQLPIGCVAHGYIDTTRKPWRIYQVSASSWTGGDLIGGKLPGGTLIVVTQRGKSWLEEHYGQWIECIPAVTTP